MSRYLILYGTSEGQTAKIASFAGALAYSHYRGLKLWTMLDIAPTAQGSTPL